MKIEWINAAKIAVTAALLCFVALKVDVAKAVDNMRFIDARFFIACYGVSFLALFLQAIKTRYLVPDFSLRTLFRINVISQFFGLVLLGQVGSDIAKTGYMMQHRGGSHHILAAVLFDRITSLVGLVGLAAVGLLVAPTASARNVTLSLVVILLALVASLLAPILLPDALVRCLLGMLPAGWATRLHQTFRSIRGFSANPRLLVVSLAMGLVAQAVIVANCALLGEGLGIHLPLATWTVIICVMSLVLLLPISVGGIGLRDVTLVGMLAACGVAGDAALAMSLAMLALQVLMASVGGLLLLMPTTAVRR